MPEVKGKISAVLIALSLYGCADNGPSGPSSTPGAGSGGNDPFTEGVLSGRVVNAVTGDPVETASITVDGMGTISVDASGVFRIERSMNGSVRIAVEAPGYWTRETGMRPVGNDIPQATLTLLPDGNDFDLEFFDHVFRHLGEAGTHRWTYEPRFELWEGVYECTGFVEGEGCEELTAREPRAPAAFLARMREVIETDARSYSDGHILGSNIVTRSHPPGTILPQSQYFANGTVTVALVERRDTWSWAFWRFDDAGAMTSANIQMNVDDQSFRGVYSHELAHTLGFDHPLGQDRVPLSSIMRQDHGDGPTRFDVLHGAVLYGRPPDSRTPDLDPASFVWNALRRAQSGTGGETTLSAR